MTRRSIWRVWKPRVLSSALSSTSVVHPPRKRLRAESARIPPASATWGLTPARRRSRRATTSSIYAKGRLLLLRWRSQSYRGQEAQLLAEEGKADPGGVHPEVSEEAYGI